MSVGIREGGEGGQTASACSSWAASRAGVGDQPEGRPGRLGERVAAAANSVCCVRVCLFIHWMYL